MFGSKKRKNKFCEERCCAFCEYAEFTDDEYIMLCQRKKKKVDSDSCCRKFTYDLLKRKPRVMMEIPTIDPEALEL